MRGSIEQEKERGSKMNLKKCKALKTLGFKYITRDMDGRLVAWMNEPIRSIYCLEEFEENIKNKYGKDVCISVGIECAEDAHEWTNGVYPKMCGFQCSSKDNVDTRMYSYGHFEIFELDNEFEEVTWDNSPYKF